MRSLIIVLLLASGCSPTGQSDLSRSLTVAVEEKKISHQAKEQILAEYKLLREEDKAKAREFAAQIVSALEMGADSSHIDVLRKRARIDSGLKKV